MFKATADADSSAHLLDDVVSADVIAKPYAHFIRQNKLAADLYASLANEFPSLREMLGARQTYGNNEAIRLTAHQVLSDRKVSRLWLDFFAYHTSQDFWRQIVRVFASHIRQEYPELEERVGRPLEEWRVVPRGFPGDADIRLDCQFVMNTPVKAVSTVKSAHVDLCDKIFSALYYLRAPEDHVAGGDFEIYAWTREPRFLKHRALACDLELVKTVSYEANSFLCFVNSPKSVHAVSPRGITDIPRRYINFIAEMPANAFNPKQVSRWQQFWLPKNIKLAAHNDKY